VEVLVISARTTGTVDTHFILWLQATIFTEMLAPAYEIRDITSETSSPKPQT